MLTGYGAVLRERVFSEAQVDELSMPEEKGVRVEPANEQEHILILKKDEY